MTGTKDLKFRIAVGVTGQGSVDKLRGSVQGLSSAGGSLATGLKALAGAFVVKEAIQFGKNLIDTADSLRDLSQKTGVSVKDLASFQAAAEQADLPLEGLEGGLRKLSQSMVAAATGSKEAQAAFRAIGVTATDASGQLRPTGDVVKSLADKFAVMKDGPEKAALAIKLFGKSGTDMIPFLNEGSDALERFGLAIDEDFANRADTFNDTLSRLGNQFKNAGITGLKEMLPTLQEIASAFENIEGEDPSEIFKVLGEAVRLSAIALYAFGQAAISGADGVIFLARIIKDELIRILEDLGDRISTRASQLKALASLDFSLASQLGDDRDARIAAREKSTLEQRVKLFEELTGRVEQREKKFQSFKDALLKNSILFGEGTAEEIAARQKEETKPDPRPTRDQAAGLNELNKARATERDLVAEFAEKQNLENEQRRAALGDINLTKQELEQVTEARKIEQEAQRASKGLNEEQRVALAAVTEELKKQRAEIVALEQAQERSFTGGLKRGLRDFADEALNTGKQIEGAIKNAFSGMTDALTDFVKTGKLDFASLANSIIDDMIRIAVQQSITGPLAQMVGSFFSPAAAVGGGGGQSLIASANGNVLGPGGVMPLQKYAAGGIARSPQLALFGEAGPEAFVPLPDGRNIPVKMEGGGGTSVVVNVNMQTGETSSAGGEKGKQLGALIAAQVKTILISERRPGGLLNA